MANYGSMPADGEAQNGTTRADDGETAALLGGKPSTTASIGKRFRRHMSVNVSNRWGDIALLFSYIITGLLDSCAVFIWGSFLSMQTGLFGPCSKVLIREFALIPAQATRSISALV